MNVQHRTSNFERRRRMSLRSLNYTSFGSSFRRRPESSHINGFQLVWTPVFTGVTTFYESIKVKSPELLFDFLTFRPCNPRFFTMKVKICGITNQEDASAAVKLGVDALGFIFAKSPRQIEPEKARSIINALPPFVTAMGVFVNESSTRVKEIVSFCGLNLIQFHGDESPDMCSEFMPHSVKAFQIKDKASLEGVKPYNGNVRALLFDTYSKEKRGGTGKTFDWGLAVKGKELGIPVILSGGLSPSNISEAISTVRPYAVDVNSGVETSPGKKDHGLMRQLMEQIQSSP